ncbi:MAG: MFS transporter [Gammaproteobacteria bacterium]|nr:MFS transporter [Gammaproteobacteria bacterium]MBU1646030.1 MFS transporter [Gammaproteobacteria bacterium]MBU1972092.1 MFS transporter [Gammaproteobacteria bacterium]
MTSTTASAASDRRRLYAAAFLRALATGMAGVLLGLYIARLGLSASWLGLVLSVGLMGATLSVAVATWWGDRLGRRRALLWLAALSAGGGVVLALGAEGSRGWLIVAAALLGMVNGMGRDRGAALVLEQAIMPATTDDAGRTAAFARYNLLMDIGHALGALAGALPALLLLTTGMDELAAYRAAFLVYAALLAAGLPLYAGLSAAAEAPPRIERLVLSPQSRKVLARISALFAIDSIAGGFIGAALISWFFFERFGTSAAVIGLLFFGARLMNAVSHLGAAWLAARIGLVNTMVFTHIPSSLLLLTVPLAPTFSVAAILFLLREGLVEMDVPTRQSYVMAMVRPEERTFASGVTHLVRLGGWAVAPAFAGWLMQAVALGAPLAVGAVMKIGYDLALWASFRKLKPPEER